MAGLPEGFTIGLPPDEPKKQASGLPPGFTVGLPPDEPAAPPAMPPEGTTPQSVSAWDVGKTSFASNRGEAVDFLAKRIFPKIPLEQSRQYFTEKDGKIAYRGSDGKEHVVADSVWKRMMLGLGPALPVGAGAVGGVLSAPLMATGIGTLGSIGITGAAAAGGEAARQKIGDYLMDTPDPSLNAGSIAYEGAANALGQGFGKGLSSLSERYAVKDLAKFRPGATQQAYSRGKRWGVDLTPAEATDLPSLKAQQKRFGNITATGNEMGQFYGERDQQVYGAWDKFLNSISKNGNADDVAESARRAAQDALESTRAVRSRAASPHYQAAFQADPPVDTAPILKSIDERLAYAKGGIKTALTNTRNLLVEGDKPDTRLRAMHEAKMALDDMIEGARESGLGNTAKRELVGIKNQLLDAMDAASPDYAQARKVFAGESGAVNEAMDSTVKALANLKDTNLQKAALTVLNPSTRSAGAVTRARGLLEKADPEVWQGIKRTYLQQEMETAFRVAQSGEVVNPAGKLYANLSRGPMLRNLRAAMTTDEYSRLGDFLQVMKRAASVKRIGSDTEWNRIMTQEAEDAARPLVIKGIRILNPAATLRAVDEFFTSRAMDKQAQTAVKIITSGDPEAVKALRELRQLSPADYRWRALFGHVLIHGGEYATQEAVQ